MKPHIENVFPPFRVCEKAKADQKEDRDYVNIDFCNYYLQKSAKFLLCRISVSILRNLNLKNVFRSNAFGS